MSSFKFFWKLIAVNHFQKYSITYVCQSPKCTLQTLAFNSLICSLHFLNPIVPNAPFSTPWKHQKTFWCFQGVKKGCTGNKCVNLDYFLRFNLREAPVTVSISWLTFEVFPHFCSLIFIFAFCFYLVFTSMFSNYYIATISKLSNFDSFSCF